MKYFLALFFIVLAGAPSLASSQEAGEPAEEEITRFQASIVVRSDAVLEVTEEITAFFPEPKHGIFRDIPVSYRDRYGNRQSIRLTVVGVTDDKGGNLPYKLSREGRNLRVKIGGADKTVQGELTYRLRYTVERALLFLPDSDELYWNVSGNDWLIPLRRVSAAVELPSGISSAGVKTFCYTGPVGSQESNCTMGASQGLYIFDAREPLTIAVNWPKGFVVRPTAVTAARDFILDNIGLLAPLLVFIALFWTWWSRGRDPKIGTIMAEYEPPDKLRPAEVDALKDESVGREAVSATVVDWAVRGYLRIEEKEAGRFFHSKFYVLHRLREADSSLSDRERNLFAALFPDGAAEITLDELKNSTGMQKAREGFQKGVLEDLVRARYFAANPARVRAVYAIAGIALAFVLFFMLDQLMIWFGTASVVGFFFSAALVVIFGQAMPRRLPKGALAYRQAMGFKLYLSQAEKYRLQWQEKEKIFEKFLPYAMVFGVVGAWAAVFKTLGIAAPAWYVGTGGGVFDPVSFGQSINSFTSSANAALAPSSSGSSGGGSSGGGFGGGGGGSW